MKKNLTNFISIYEFIFASTALGAIVFAPIHLSLKIAFWATFFLFAGALEFQNFQLSTFFESKVGLDEVAFRYLERKLEGNVEDSLSNAYQQHLKSASLLDLAAGEGSAYVVALTAKVGLWAAGGLLVGIVILPGILKS